MTTKVVYRHILLAMLLGLMLLGTEEPVQAAETTQGFRTEGPLRLLFIHHSCGGQLLAGPGEKIGGAKGSGERCIYQSHPNGGGLRTLLEKSGYEVHEASYESVIGGDTDIRHWRTKFAAMMERILVTDQQDRIYEDGQTNHVVVFKSCYPNNDFVGPGVEPGDPDAEELTIANAKAAYRSLLPLFAEHPEVMFVAVTAPARAEAKLGLMERVRNWFQREKTSGEYAQEFNGWLAGEDSGWLAGYDSRNIGVFNYYDILTNGGESCWSQYATGGGRDSHPSRAGNEKAANEFIVMMEKWRSGEGSNE